MATLGDVLEHQWGPTEELTKERKDCLQEILLKSLGENALRVELRDYFKDGKSKRHLEKMVGETTSLTGLERGFFYTFVEDCCEWSRKGFKIPRVAHPHDRFRDIVGAPSQFGKEWAQKQSEHSLEIMCARPYGSAWINARIMHPVFAQMVDALSDQGMPESCDYTLARMLTVAMPASYKIESDRRDEINRIFNEYLFRGTEITGFGVQGIENFATDGSVLKSGFTVKYKNEKGSGDGDPYMQNLAYYVNYWYQKDGPTQHCCPFILMEVLGQEMGLSAAVWTCGRPTAQPLSPNIPFLPIPADQRIFRMQARLCLALRIGTAALHTFYQTAGAIPASLQAQFPFPRKAKFDGSECDVEFVYSSVFAGEELRKMLFVAQRTDNNEFVLVKFTDSYGDSVHRALAEKHLAPKLHDVRRETGLAMVVMELLTESRMWNSNDRLDPQKVAPLRRVEKLLDSKNYVHGDLRAPNVHVVNDRDIYILDFDWAGSEGKARYPDLLNPGETWPEGAQVDAVITKEHDKFMINILLGINE